jgi:hypothetical protein
MRRKLSLSESSTPSTEYSGILLFKIIITEAQVDTVDDHTHVKLSAGLPDMMAECGSNVKAFNQEVRSIQRETDRRGQNAQTILPSCYCLFWIQKDGKSLMEQLENATDGTVQLDTILMSKAEEQVR